MAFKTFEIKDVGPVNVYKRRGAKFLRIGFSAGGKVRVTIPTWAPYRAGVDFATAKAAWILARRPSKDLLRQNQPIGKAHHLHFEPSPATAVRSRLAGNAVHVTHPAALAVSSPTVQQAAQRGALRALRHEADRLLPQRLRTLAAHYGFTFRAVRVKPMKSRWGSCNQDKDIMLNCYLMEVDWQLIDYVLVHELAHTENLHHGPAFWARVRDCLPDYQSRRQDLRALRPTFLK